MKVCAAVQSTKNGRVLVILTDEDANYHWVRATPGYDVQGPFETLAELLEDMAYQEEKPQSHLIEVFTAMYPSLPIQEPLQA